MLTEISIRHRVPLPASLTFTAKALAQMQLTAAKLDDELDSFEVAGRRGLWSATAAAI